MSIEIYWEGLGLGNPYSGIGRYAENIRCELKCLGVVPKVLGVKASGRIAGSKLFHPWWSRFELASFPSCGGLVHGLANTNVLPLLPSRYRQILTVHDVIPLFPDAGVSRLSASVFSWALSQALKRADLILVPSELTKRYLESYEPQLKTVKVLGYGFPKLQPHIQKNSDEKSKKPVILTVSRWEPYKGFEDLVELVKRSPDWVFRVVTDRQGSLWLARQLGQKRNLEVFSEVSSEVLQGFYREASLVLQPSRYEGFGLPVAEALSFCKPVVFRRGTAAEEFAPRFLGSAYSCPEEAFEVMKRLVQQDWSDDLKVWFQSHAKTWENYATDLASEYHDMIS
ncbi:MAG: glycosyltransferase [Oligoflexales bacterium]